MNKRENLLQNLIQKIGCIAKMINTAQVSFNGVNLNAPQITIMFCLSKSEDGVYTKDLATSLNVTAGAISQFVDELVNGGIIHRAEDKTDRRMIKLTLTEKAKNNLESFQESYLNVVKQSFTGLSEVEVEQTFKTLSKVSF